MNLKKLKLFALLPSLVLTLSCAEENLENGKNEEILASRPSTSLIIEWNETPELTSNVISLIGFGNLTYDESRDVILDTENSILSVPYDAALSIETSIPPNEFVALGGIILAKKNVKPGGPCKSCVNCIGFRCGTTSTVEIVGMDEINFRNANSVVSGSRNQSLYIQVNKVDKTIDYHFFNDITWNTL